MPQQLIHTSSARLLDCTGGGYGTVARSEGMPRILREGLTALSGYREVAGRHLRGAQYTYRVLEHRGTARHVLTRVRVCGADYSCRACHIAHHLVLSGEEAAAMQRHPARPTPAGIMLAMEARGLWKDTWCGEPAFLAEAPAFCAADMPAADAQPTWKRMTGHKGNACAFRLPPYARGCVLLVPPGTEGADILHLLHEADWLTRDHGWGHTFTTAAEDSDSFADTHRMACTAAARGLLERARAAGRRILEIAHGLELPSEPQPNPAP